jgi:glyoxylase-like metal-dependent hydrolase (beta-lactamase superfamily II)
MVVVLVFLLTEIMYLVFLISFLIPFIYAQLDPNKPYPITVGKVKIWRLQDSSRTATPYTVMFPSLTMADWEGLNDINGNAWINSAGQFSTAISYSGTLLNSQGKWILVDDGLGSLVTSTQPTRIPQLVELSGAALTDINFVALTHFHTDHTGWNVNGAAQNAIEFPNAQYIAQLDEIDYWRSTPALRNQSNFQNLIQPVITSGQLVGVNGLHAITPEVSVIPCKGHTPGHQCVEINSDGQIAIIIGDAMHHPSQIQRPDWSAVYDWNTTYSVPLRQSLVARMGQQNILLIAGHYYFPGVGHVVKDPHPIPNTSGLIFQPVSVNA